ncbi:caspase family protein [Dyadobacter beijingensis]|uniref:caspase family protein n=2 Tax=Dyadobacter beijingensis TaxID=365489 RepID=UPI000A011C32|nr:caspase family protein [Dyadobacter beijingensis]
MIQEFNTRLKGPKTHVLLIGVGGYPYLKGGTEAKQQSPELAGLGQLTSPVASVKAMYEKVMEYNVQDVWSKPLGSIEMLLTPPPGLPPVFPGMNVENASLANIEDAYFSWKKRCDAHEENVALFYYCGHGFQKKYHFLLADDFGKQPANPWRGAFNFDDTRDAFYSCKAATPIFLVDACRQVTIEMLEKDLTVAPIDLPSLSNPEESKNHLTLKATASGQVAYGKKNMPTYFTQAVISGLDGLVARQDENEHWLVDTSSLGLNIHRLLELINSKQSFKQRCQINSGIPTDIVRRKTAPIAWLEVSCDPATALPLAGLTCTEDDEGASAPLTRKPMPDAWKLNIKAATYKLAATFEAGGDFTGGFIKTSLIPPFRKINVKCQ